MARRGNNLTFLSNILKYIPPLHSEGGELALTVHVSVFGCSGEKGEVCFSCQTAFGPPGPPGELGRPGEVGLEGKGTSPELIL